MLSDDAPVIEWVNHASFVFEYGDVRLICDPWLHGTAFNRGWRLLSESAFRPEDFSGLTHVWFSHQHPDHFSPRDVKLIPPAIRARLDVLYQATLDKKVIRFCQGLHFAGCSEMPDRVWQQLAPGLLAMCGKWDDRDSWIAFKTPHATFLNMNDCMIETPRQARGIAKTVGPVDVLFTQYSYASWAGNDGDTEAHRAHAQKKLTEMRLQVETFNPKIVVPFASYIYFSHEENFYNNAQMNRVGDVARFIVNGLGRTAVVLYPGQRWRFGDPHDWKPAAERYGRDFDAILERGPLDRSPTVPFERVARAALEYVTRVKMRNPVIGFVPGLRTSVDVTDWDCAVELSMSGMRRIPRSAPVDLRCGSDSLFFALKMPWGANALSNNGRFGVPRNGDRQRFFRFFRAGDLNDHGYALDHRWAARQIAKRLAQRAATLAHRQARASVTSSSSDL